MKEQIIRADSRHRKAINSLIRKAKLGSTLKQPVRNAWIIKRNNKIVACACMDFVADKAAIFTHLVVKKELRHQGIGSALIQHRMDIAKSMGIKTLALVTMYYHYNFYKRRGFKTIPRSELPDCLQNYWMFTAQRYKKCAVMVGQI